MTSELAPCIAVVGPAKAGKTTLLHQLDEKLQAELESVLVIKGNPDGEGRYLFRAPAKLRDDPEFKRQHKGQWGEFTIGRICEWIQHGRRNLRLALLDFGGAHNPENDRMLCLCSHYIVVARESDSDGMRSWVEVCEKNKLVRIASISSIGPDSTSGITSDSPFLPATFVYEARPGEAINDTVLNNLVHRLCLLSVPQKSARYISLWRTDRWTEEMIPSVGELNDVIRLRAEAGGPVVLGGRAPIWAYLAALRCALSTNADVKVFFFDPRQPQGLIEIPAAPEAASPPCEDLAISWAELPGGIFQLTFELTATDKWLPGASRTLSAAPWKSLQPLPETVVLNGQAPIWLYGAYARWLHKAGVKKISSWDMALQKYVQVWT